MEKILSVSVAAYNVESTLEEALQSFVGSRCLDRLDIMIIDDGSKDNTSKIARKYVEQYPDAFRLISKENGGWGSTLNVGMKQARGKYFKSLDGDDYFSKENLDGYIAFLSQCEADLVHTPYVIYEHKTGAVLDVIGVYGKNVLPKRRVVAFSELEGFIPAMHTMTVKTELLKDHPLDITEHCFYTDVEYLLKCCNLSRTAAYYELPIYYYRLARSGQSMSVQGVRRHYKDHLRMLKKMMRYEKDYVTSESKKKLFQRRLADACDMQYKFFFAMKHDRQKKREIRQFDQMLQKEYPYYFEATKSRMICLLRRYKFFGYKILAEMADRRYKKMRLGVYEGG